MSNHPKLTQGTDSAAHGISSKKAAETRRNHMNIWSCKIGEVVSGKVPPGGDGPMRKAVGEAYMKLTGEAPNFLFSGWGAELDEYERAALQPQSPSSGIVEKKSRRRVSRKAPKPKR